jgi:hypothetical protein
MCTLLRIAQRASSATLLAATIMLTGCSLDVGPEGSNCVVYGQNHPGSPNGLTVLATLPRRCPFEINTIPQVMAFSATVLASSAFTPDGSYLYHVLRNRVNRAVQTEVTNWNESVSGLVSSIVSSVYPAATGVFVINGTPSSTAGTGQDLWYSSTEQLDTANLDQSLGVKAIVQLSYYRDYQVTIETDVAFANPYEPVNLAVTVPSWVPSPYRHVWYRNGEFVGEGGQTMTFNAGGPNETVQFEVTTTGSDGTQIRGARSLTSREHSCGDPNAIIC